MKIKKRSLVMTFIKLFIIGPLILFILIVTFIIVGYYMGRWTEKDKQNFARECAQTEFIDRLGISFTGFSYDEIETVLLKRIHQGRAVDSFYIKPGKDNSDKLRSRYWASIDTTIHIQDTYLVIIPQSYTFVLSDMKMGIMPRFTMLSENYGCEMREYSIDGIKFEGSSTPDFVKPGFKYPWEEILPDTITRE